jgi:hypothetical protein
VHKWPARQRCQMTAGRTQKTGVRIQKDVTFHSDKSAFLCHCEAFRPKQSQPLNPQIYLGVYLKIATLGSASLAMTKNGQNWTYYPVNGYRKRNSRLPDLSFPCTACPERAFLCHLDQGRVLFVMSSAVETSARGRCVSPICSQIPPLRQRLRRPSGRNDKRHTCHANRSRSPEHGRRGSRRTSRDTSHEQRARKSSLSPAINRWLSLVSSPS